MTGERDDAMEALRAEIAAWDTEQIADLLSHPGRLWKVQRRAAFALAEREGLDVERLAQALAVGLNCGGCDKDQRHAQRIAAEYARLAQPSEAKPTP